MTTYKSKIGLELVVPVALILGWSAIGMAFLHAWLGLLLLVCVAAFIAYMFATTYYTITEDTVKIKCGFLIDQTIDIGRIKAITETHNPLSSPALSIDRLEITYNTNDSVLISPKEKAAFVTHLTRIKPDIEVNWKNKHVDRSFPLPWG